MKQIKYFHLKNCPYCIKANNWIKELREEYPEFQDVFIEKIEETEQHTISNKYDYYYVPAFYVDGVKKHEGVASKELIKRIFEAALN